MSIDCLAVGSSLSRVAVYKMSSREAARLKPVEMMCEGEAQVSRTGRGESCEAVDMRVEGRRGSRRWICFVLVDRARREPSGDQADEEI